MWARTWWRRWRTTTSMVWTLSARWPSRMLMFKWLLCQVTRPMYSLTRPLTLTSQVTVIRAMAMCILANCVAFLQLKTTCNLLQAFQVTCHSVTVRNTRGFLPSLHVMPKSHDFHPITISFESSPGFYIRLFLVKMCKTISSLSRSNGFFDAID